MAHNYGLPYMGSKNTIADALAANIPHAPVFVDLFAGGCAVTHRILERGKYGVIYANDITDAPQLFADAVAGKYADNGRQWVTRQQFDARKASDPFVRLLWSFGNNGDTYLYAREIEDYKRAYHVAAVEGDGAPFARMGIDLPAVILQKPPTARRLAIARWIKANADDVRARYVAHYVRTHPDTMQLTRQQAADRVAELEAKMQAEMFAAFRASGLRLVDINRHLGNFMAGHYFTKNQWAVPTPEAFAQLQKIMKIKRPAAEIIERRKCLQTLSSWDILTDCNSISSLQALEALERLERLESLGQIKAQALHVLQLTYADAYASIMQAEKARPVVCYCDPPYRGTAEYISGAFDWAAFDDWVRAQVRQPGAALFLISEYTMPADFVPVFQIAKRNLLSATANKAATERLYVHNTQITKYNEMMGNRRLVQTALF